MHILWIRNSKKMKTMRGVRKMKRYKRTIYALFAAAFVFAGGAKVWDMAGEEVFAQEGGLAGEAPEHTLPAAKPVPAPSMVTRQGGEDISRTVTSPADAKADTTPGRTTANTTLSQEITDTLSLSTAANTITPTPTPMILVSNGAPLIQVDYANYAAWLTVGPNDKYIIFEVMKAKKAKDGSLTYTPGNQYMYDLTELASQVLQKTIRIDLSFLKATNTQYIQIHGDANPLNVSGVIPIAAQPKKPSIKYVGGTFTAKIDKQQVTLNPIQLDAYEYKTLYGSKWESLRNYNGMTSSIAGTTLLIREKATATSPAGVEAKLKIPAAAKAPKVTIDYVKGTINIPKSVEFKISFKGKEGNWAVYRNDKGAEAASKLSPTEVLGHFIPYIGGPLTAEDKTAALEVDGFSIIARTKKVEKNGVVTKAASQPAFLTIPATKKVIKAEKEDKILGSVPTVYLTYKNVENGVELTAVGGSFDYSIDNGKSWKVVKPDAKKPTVATPKKDVNAVLVRESGTKAVTSKDGKVTLARLPSSNSISTSWAPPLEIDVAGQGLGTDAMYIRETEKAELNFGVSQGKHQVTDASIKHTTTLPASANLIVANGAITFVAPAYNETGTNNYVIEITAEKANYTPAVLKINVTVTR